MRPGIGSASRIDLETLIKADLNETARLGFSQQTLRFETTEYTGHAIGLRFTMNSIASVATVLGLVLGCAKSEAPSLEPLPSESAVESAESAAESGSAPDSAESVDRQTLAAAGYYTWDEAKLAWAERKKANLKFGDGSELVGETIPEWQLSDWVGGSPTSLSELRGRVVVVRFWTSPDCPFCSKTLPALQILADEFADKPLSVIGAYHAKPESSVANMNEPAKLAAQWKVRFPIALDREWRTLRAWWLSSAPRNATSVTFVVGKGGRIAFVHPGPVFHPSDDPAEAKQNRDYLAVRQAIATELAK